MLSPLHGQLLDLLRRGALPATEHLRPETVVPYLSAGFYAFGAWPIFVDRDECRRQVGPVVANLPRILYTALRARFRGDLADFESTLGLPAELYAHLLRHPVDTRDIFVRYDAVWNDGALKLLEINAGTSAGGWQLGDWMHPHMTALFQRHPASAAWTADRETPLVALLRQTVGAMQRRNGGRRGGHVLFFSVANSADGHAPFAAYLQRVYASVRPAAWSDARVHVFHDYDALTFPGNGDVCLDGVPMDAVVLAFPPLAGIPPAVESGLLDAYLRGRVAFPDSPLHKVLGDKRLFALAHECARDGLLAPADAALVQRHVPWTAHVRHGADPALAATLRRRQHELVLKRADSCGGTHVLVGARVPQEQWSAQVDACFDNGRWVAQDYCAPGRLELADAAGLADHELIWGLFGTGVSYAGAFVRAQRRDAGGGVINASNGATEYLVFTAPEAPRPTPIAPDVAAATAALSALNLRQARLLADAPRDARLDRTAAGVPEFLRNYAFDVAAWPVFVDAELLRRHVEPLVAALPRIVYKAILSRFRKAPDELTAAFGWPRDLCAALIAARPNPADTLIRYDAVLGPDGVKLLEINSGSSIGGWLHDWMAPVAAANVAGLDGGAWPIEYRAIFERMLGYVAARLPAGCAGNVLVHGDSSSPPAARSSFTATLQAAWDHVRPATHAAGRILVCTRADDVAFDADGLSYAGAHVDAVLLPFATADELSSAFYERLHAAAARGEVVSADGHYQRLLGDKRLFALLHECAQQGLLPPTDAALVARSIPWTARVVAGPALRDGVAQDLPALLAGARDDFVLKRGVSFGGRDVVVGRAVDAATWDAAIAQALADGDWIAQAYCAPARQLLCAPRHGLAEHELIWGLFAFGGRYAGAFVRAWRSGAGSGVINSANGACEFLVFEDTGAATLESGFAPRNRQLLDALQCDARLRDERLDLAGEHIPAFLRGWSVQVGAWPLVVGKDFARTHFAAAVERVPRALFRAMRARFGADSRAFADYFDMPAGVYELLRHAPPDLRELHARYDMIVDAHGARILEINASSAAGGFQLDWVEPACSAILARHATTAAWPVRRRAVFGALLESLVQALQRRGADVAGNLLFYCFVGADRRDALQAALQQAYDVLKPPQFASGRVHVFADFAELRFDAAGDLTHAGARIDAVLFTFPDAVAVPPDTYERLLDLYLKRRLVFPDNPLHLTLDSKLQLALAHECCEQGLLGAAERDLLRATIPWTAALRERDVEWEDERGPLSRLLLRRRDRFVLKKARSFGGRDVVVGAHCVPAEWETLVARCLADGGWLAQEYCVPGQVRLPHPEHGVCVHDLVWGVFTFGGRYGGAFLRGKPARGGNGVINAANGAAEYLVYEETE